MVKLKTRAGPCEVEPLFSNLIPKLICLNLRLFKNLTKILPGYAVFATLVVTVLGIFVGAFQVLSVKSPQVSCFNSPQVVIKFAITGFAEATISLVVRISAPHHMRRLK